MVMWVMYLLLAFLSVCLTGAGIKGAYGEDYPKSVFYGFLSFIGSVLFIASVVTAFIPDFFAK